MKEKAECLNCNSKENCLDIASLEAYTDQYIKDSWDKLPQKEKNKRYIVSALETICVFGIIIALIATVVFLLFQLENGSEIISLIDDLLCGVFAAFIWIFILNMIDLFS